MGLGKTVMTLALLAHLAVERGVWGQHLIVVPTSVIVNWEMEFKRWLPAFKILAYHGNAKERKIKRRSKSRARKAHAAFACNSEERYGRASRSLLAPLFPFILLELGTYKHIDIQTISTSAALGLCASTKCTCGVRVAAGSNS
jgi:hypothetical protein